MTYELTLTEAHMTTLSGILDAYYRAVGIRASAPDVTDLVRAVDGARKIWPEADIDQPFPPRNENNRGT